MRAAGSTLCWHVHLSPAAATAPCAHMQESSLADAEAALSASKLCGTRLLDMQQLLSEGVRQEEQAAAAAAAAAAGLV